MLADDPFSGRFARGQRPDSAHPPLFGQPARPDDRGAWALRSFPFRRFSGASPWTFARRFGTVSGEGRCLFDDRGDDEVLGTCLQRATGDAEPRDCAGRSAQRSRNRRCAARAFSLPFGRRHRNSSHTVRASSIRLKPEPCRRPQRRSPDQVPYGAEAAFAEAKAFLCSREARQMSESDLERELYRRGQELVHKLLQGHLEQRSPREAAGPVDTTAGGEDPARAASPRGETVWASLEREPWEVVAEATLEAERQDPEQVKRWGHARRWGRDTTRPRRRERRLRRGRHRGTRHHPHGKPVDTCADYLQKGLPQNSVGRTEDW